MSASRPTQMENPPRVALVTGAGRRIGREIALSLARDGWAVGVHYRNSRNAAAGVVAEVETMGGRAAALEADLEDAAALPRLVDACAVALGAPTCLVNNASEFLEDTIATVEPETWDRHLDSNLKAPVFLAQAFARTLPTGATGTIINIVDQKILKLTPDFFSYTIAKSALWTATQTLAQALAPRIRVNAIAPGPVFRSVHQSDATFAAEQASTLLRVGPSPQEIASAIKFILDSPSMTGAMLTLDAGQHLA